MMKAYAHGPDFLGIGAPRCGTTWLHTMLRRHPQIWLPPLKEVHFFDSIDPTIHERTMHRWQTRLKTQLPRRAVHYLLALKGNGAKPDLDWDVRYFTPGDSVEWYLRLFEGKRARHRMIGEITPAYFMLSSETINRIKEETRIRKLILMLRDPIESAWSGYGRKVREGQNKSTLGNPSAVAEEIIASTMRRRQYASNVSRWLDCFNREQLFIGFYEDLTSNPRQLLDRIFEFLEVDPVSPLLVDQVDKRVNSSADSRGDVPPAIEHVLAQHLEPELRELARILGGVTLNWHQRALNALREPTLSA